MTATLNQARNEIWSTFQDAWEADSTSELVPVLYPDVSGEPPEEGAWVRASMIHTGSTQVTLSNETGARRFRRSGIVTIQIMTPCGMGLTLSDQLTKIAMRAFEGVTTSPGGVMFLNVRPIEAGQSGNWYQVNVLADFQYDEVR